MHTGLLSRFLLLQSGVTDKHSPAWHRWVPRLAPLLVFQQAAFNKTLCSF